jgi:hypothetical protein
MLESAPLQARLRDADYNYVAEYDGVTTVTNTVPGYLDSKLDGETRLAQGSEDFDAETLYTLSFRPVNPLPTMAVVKVVYPATVGLPGGDGLSQQEAFEADCKASTPSFFGTKDWGGGAGDLKYCFLRPADFDD